MNKQAFLEELQQRLQGLPSAEIEKSLAYYSEMLDDRIEDGLSEEEAVAAIGTVDEAVTQILSDVSLPTLLRQRVTPDHRLQGWEIALLIIGSPLWIAIGIAAVAVFAAVYVVLWSVIVALCAANLALAIGAVAGIAGCVVFLLSKDYLQALFLLGSGFILAGISILLFMAFRRLTAMLIHCSVKFVPWVKHLFITRGVEK